MQKISGGILLCSIMYGLSNIVYGAKFQFFLGLGQSIGDAKLTTESTNQMTHNTSTVNSAGQYYYMNTQHGQYNNGNVKNITSGYAGVEATIDKQGIFTVRGYATVSYSNNADFGNLDRNSVHDGNMRKCNTNEIPTASECWRDSFYIPVIGSGTSTATEVKFNPNPGFSDSITKNATMITYGIGADIGINIPITFLVQRFTGYKKLIPLRIGVYGGAGYEFATYNLGYWDNRTYNNTTTGGITWDPGTGNNGGQTTNVDGVILNANDTFYMAGAGMFARVGASVYISNNLRLDIGVKFPINFTTESTKWYQRDAIDTTNMPINDPDAPIFRQQNLIQNYKTTIQSYWQFSVNVLF